ncbi:MAG: LacI family DNA-binding transcriptional regulator [Blautia sp.]|jgi:DNA-binding LacI/PurR family transcriptional regulator
MTIKNKDIAKMLNLSPASVSLARNNKPGVSEQTRKMVNELLKDLEREKISGESAEVQGTIALVMHKAYGKIIAETQFFLTVTEIIQEKALELGYHVIILQFNAGDDIGDFIKHLNELNICGLFLLATEIQNVDLEHYKKIGLPMLVLDSFFQNSMATSVVIDNYDAMYQVIRYSVQMGHRKIGFLRSKIENNNFKERYQGFQLALEEFGIEKEPNYIFEVGTGIDDSYEDMKQILSEGRELPSLLVAGNDILAIGALKALKEYGKKVPDDISIIGFDDMPVTRMMDPPLCSVKIYMGQFGEQAVSQMVGLLGGKTQGHVCVRVGCELMVRNSVKKLN